MCPKTLCSPCPWVALLTWLIHSQLHHDICCLCKCTFCCKAAQDRQQVAMCYHTNSSRPRLLQCTYAAMRPAHMHTLPSGTSVALMHTSQASRRRTGREVLMLFAMHNSMLGHACRAASRRLPQLHQEPALPRLHSGGRKAQGQTGRLCVDTH